jgi:hypothetical protein
MSLVKQMFACKKWKLSKLQGSPFPAQVLNFYRDVIVVSVVRSEVHEEVMNIKMPHKSLTNYCIVGLLFVDVHIVVYVDGGKTTSLNCDHWRAYCSSTRRYMNMENHDEMISTEETPDLSTRALLTFIPADSSSRETGGTWWKKCAEFCLRNIFHTRRIL